MQSLQVEETEPSSPYTAVIFFHGMGNQRRYESLSELADAVVGCSGLWVSLVTALSRVLTMVVAGTLLVSYSCGQLFECKPDRKDS